jgi:23S rRNA pseudouridine1911/1915/1917 synthase
MHYTNNLSDINGDERPGIVHRIDKDTSGLIMVAKTNEAHAILGEYFKNKDVKREYVALIHGVFPHETATIDAPIGRDPKDRKKMTVTADNSKDAVTHLKVLKRYKEATLIELQLETGRTHQIRVHMNYINHPVVNDPVYGRRKLIDETGQCLHAKTIGFNHPSTKKYMEFTSELLECFNNILKIFEENE